MSKQAITIVLRASISLAILTFGIGTMVILVVTAPEAPKVQITEVALRVDVVPVSFKNVAVEITDYGEVRARDVVEIAPEIAGRVVSIHPDLEMGGVIPAGEVLFTIDPRDFQARYDQSNATVRQLKNSIERLKKQYSIDQQRLKTFQSTSDLAKAEYNRINELYTKDKVGTQSEVDNAEMMYNNANDSLALLSQSVDLFPIRISEAEDNLASSEAMAKLSKTNLERTNVSVPFTSRVKTVALEQDQYVSPGMPVITLANDTTLEISISLDSSKASKWLKFEQTSDDSPTAWFGKVAQIPVRITWNDNTSEWSGTLHRIETYNPLDRTINVVVRIDARNAVNPLRGTQPLVEGMFCTITIPGKIAHNVFELPSESVGFEKDENGYNSLFLAKKNPEDGQLRLTTIKVLISHKTKEFIFIGEGLSEGDLVVTTRLINPLPNSLLQTNQYDDVDTD